MILAEACRAIPSRHLMIHRDGCLNCHITTVTLSHRPRTKTCQSRPGNKKQRHHLNGILARHLTSIGGETIDCSHLPTYQANWWSSAPKSFCPPPTTHHHGLHQPTSHGAPKLSSNPLPLLPNSQPGKRGSNIFLYTTVFCLFVVLHRAADSVSLFRHLF